MLVCPPVLYGIRDEQDGINLFMAVRSLIVCVCRLWASGEHLRLERAAERQTHVFRFVHAPFASGETAECFLCVRAFHYICFMEPLEASAPPWPAYGRPVPVAVACGCPLSRIEAGRLHILNPSCRREEKAAHF